MSAASGVVWAVIGLIVAWIGNQPHMSLRESVVVTAGGAVAAPLIGILMGAASRLFGGMPAGIRVVIAGGSLYVAVFLFVVASGLFSSVLHGRMPQQFWTNSFGVAWVSLVWTGFFVVLWPLSYANHTLVARAWDRRDFTDPESPAG